MYYCSNYVLAILFCVITMLCWGSWGNTQKLAGKTWRYELFYWDYVLGVVLFAILSGLTAGSMGANHAWGFLASLTQASPGNLASAFLGGIVFNAANILLAAAISIAGMSVAFPIGIGLALVLGVIVNYVGAPKGDAPTLFAGVALIVVAILCNACAYKIKQAGSSRQSNNLLKGVLLSVVCGTLMAFFYRFIACTMDLDFTKAAPAAGMMSPYSAFFVFSLGIFASTFVFNAIAMRHPVAGEPIAEADYFKGSFGVHLVGILGGLIWGLGNGLSLVAAGKAGAAISYGLGQGATLVSALWGILVWKEFRGAPRKAAYLNFVMFVIFLLGLGLIIKAGMADEPRSSAASQVPAHADSIYTVSDAEVFVDNRARGRSGHMGHALIDCGQGRILAFNSNVPTNRCDGHSGYGWMEYRVSQDYGRTWGPSRVLDYSMKLFKAGKHTALCEKGVRAPDGRIILFFQITDASRPISCEPWFEPTCIESRDGGETWSDARVACPERGRIYDVVTDSASVYFLLPTSPNFCDTNQEYVVCKSTNGGPFVRHVTSINASKKGYGAMEFAPDGSLIVYAYDLLDEAHPQYCVSRDRGQTWEKPGRCTCAKRIRNPQVRRIGNDWFMCGRNGDSWGNPGFGDALVLYHSTNGIDWDEGVKVARRPAGTGTGFYSCLLPIVEPDHPPRLLLQYSRPYWAQCVNVEHRWIELCQSSR